MKESKTTILKRFLTRLSKEGVREAKVLRSALEVQSKQENVEKYPQDSDIGNDMEVECRAFLDILKSNGLWFGRQYVQGRPLPVTIIACLPDGSTIAYRCSYDTKWKDVPVYKGPWDMDFDSNRSKIERNIFNLYGDLINAECDFSEPSHTLPLF